MFKLVGKKIAKGPFDEAPHTVSINPIDCRKIKGKKKSNFKLVQNSPTFENLGGGCWLFEKNIG